MIKILAILQSSSLYQDAFVSSLVLARRKQACSKLPTGFMQLDCQDFLFDVKVVLKTCKQVKIRSDFEDANSWARSNLMTNLHHGAVISKTYIKCAVISKTYIKCAVISKTYIKCAVISKTYIKCAVISKTYIKCAVISKTYIKCAMISKTYIKCAVISKTYIKCAVISTTYIKCAEFLTVYAQN